MSHYPSRLITRLTALATATALACQPISESTVENPAEPPASSEALPVEAGSTTAHSDLPDTVIFVIACTLRASRMHVYGNPRENTPFLDSLAQRGVKFSQTISNAPWTRPAIAALMTGQYPLRYGIDDERSKVNTDRGLDDSATTLAERFQAAGWTTVGVTGNANVNDDFNMHQGFDTYQGTTSLWRDGFKRVPAKILVENWLKATRNVEGKLFGQLVLIDTHGPLPDYPRRRDQLGLSSDEPASRVDRYDAAVLALDDSLRTLDEALTKRGRGDRLFVLVGDHGEGLERPNHHGRGHGRYLYESVLRVPWIIHGPGVAWNHKVQGLSQSVDVAPTIAELAGLPAEVSPSPDGSSRAAAVRGESDQTGERTVFSETFYADEHRARMTTPEWVYIRTFQEGTASSRGPHELYAPDDRRQAEDLSDLQPKVAQAFGRELDALRVRIGKDQTIWERPVAEETLQQLEALGYVEIEPNTTESPLEEQTENRPRASEEP